MIFNDCLDGEAPKESNTEAAATPITAPGLSALLTQEKFENLNISDITKASIKDMGFTYMTEVQTKTVPVLLEGKDVLGML